jgi:hypothetical protein
VIKEFLLPKRLNRFLTIESASFHFKAQDQVKEVAGWREPFGQEVKMVRHYAIGVNGEASSGGFGAEHVEKPRTTLVVCENFVTFETAYGDEIRTRAEIISAE